MKEYGLVGLIVTAVVSIILIGSLLAPVIQEQSEIEKTFTNDGLWRMSEFVMDDVWERSEAGVWTLNDVEQITTDNSQSSVIIGNDWTIRGNGNVYGHTVYSTTVTTPTITVGESTITINTSTISNTEGYGIKADGDYIVSKYDVPTYLHGDSPIYATGYTAVAGLGVVIHIYGTIDDGVTVECSTINNTTALSNFVVSDLSINATELTEYIDLYKLTSITFTLTMDYTAGGTTTQKTGDVSYSSYVVPYQVTAERSQHLSPSDISIIAVIPLLMIAAIVIMFVSNYRRD